MKKPFLIVFGILFALLVNAQESRTVYNFLRLPVGAHAAALGGDNVSVIDDDLSLVFSNPALLSSVSDKTLNLAYMHYMASVNMGSAAFNKMIGERASVAVGAQFVDYGKLKETNATGDIVGEFSASDLTLNAYFSYLLGQRFAGGIALKMISSSLGGYNSLAIGVDLGINYYDPEREWSLSAVAKNLGGQVKAYNDDYERLPIDLQLGVTKRIGTSPFRLSATLVDLTHWDYRFVNHLVGGVDILLSNNIWIGAGYHFRRADEMKLATDDGESSHGAGLSIGGGLSLERFKMNLAYGKYHVSSSSLLLNLSYSF